VFLMGRKWRSGADEDSCGVWEDIVRFG